MSNTAVENTEIQEALVEVRKRKRKKKIIVISIIAVILLAILGSIWLYGYKCAKNAASIQIEELTKRINELENTPVVVNPVTPEIVQSVLSNKISDIAELSSAEYTFTNAARFTDTKHITIIFDWMTKKSFVQKWDGVIKAGVKLDKMSISVEEKKIKITLPCAEILSYEVDYDSVEILDEKNNVFNPISVTDKAAFDKETAEEMKTRAIENGLLKKAQKNVEQVITNLLTTSLDIGQEYSIEYIYINN